MRCRAYRLIAPRGLWRRHLRRCEACRRYEAALRQVEAELTRPPAAGEARPELVEQVMQRLGQGETAAPVAGRRWPRYALAAAVALMVMVGVGAWLGRGAPEPGPAPGEMALWLAELEAYTAPAERRLDEPLLRLRRDAEELIEPIQRYWPALDQPPG